MSARYPPARRITRHSEFRKILTQGKRVRASDLDVRCLASPLAYLRVGIIVPLFNRNAVCRNRLKRRIREIVRVDLLSVETQADVVIRCRPSAYACNFEELRKQLIGVKELLTTHC